MSIWTDLLGAEVKFYQAGPWRTRAIEAGSGPPLILIHGGGGHAEAYAKNVIPLSKYFHVYSIDALGHGLTAKPMDLDANAKAVSDHIVAFMDAAGIDKAYVGGESMSGWMLGWTAYLHPDRVIKYVSICGAGLYPPEGKTAQEDEEAQDQGRRTRAALENPTAEGLRPRLEWLFHDTSMVTDELCETRAAIWGSPEYQAYSKRPRQGNFGRTESLWPILPEIGKRTPVLFLWTEENPGTHLSTAIRAHQITPNSQIAVIKHCGHWPQWEKASEFNEIMESWLMRGEIPARNVLEKQPAS